MKGVDAVTCVSFVSTSVVSSVSSVRGLGVIDV